MNPAKYLDILSGALFFLGLIISKLTYLPIPIFNLACRLISPICYLTAYSIWLISCQYYPDYPSQKEGWFNFLAFKNQHRAAAVIGLIGMTLSLLSIFIMPSLIISASWLYAISNTLWSIAEYHKKVDLYQLNPNDPQTIKQDCYFNYALFNTLSSVVTAAAITLSLIFPPITITVNLICTGLVWGIGLPTGYYLFKNWTIPAHSTTPVTPQLGRDQQQQKSVNEINYSEEKPSSIPEVNPALKTLGPSQSSLTCQMEDVCYIKFYDQKPKNDAILSPQATLNLV